MYLLSRRQSTGRLSSCRKGRTLSYALNVEMVSVGGGSGFSIEISAEEVNVPHHVNLLTREMLLWHSDGDLVPLLCFIC